MRRILGRIIYFVHLVVVAPYTGNNLRCNYEGIAEFGLRRAEGEVLLPLTVPMAIDSQFESVLSLIII